MRIFGQESFLLATPLIEAAITKTGGMLAPVTFYPNDAQPFRPYAVAPWAEEMLPAGTPNMIAVLRGDWFCSAFGANEEPHNGRRLPPHGETSNLQWQLVTR